MNLINKIVVIFFSSLLAIILIFIVIDLDKNKYKFTPIISDCPDYWTTTLDTTNENIIKCVNSKKLGNCEFPKLNITKQKLNSNNYKCSIKRRLNNCNITWDGITNNDTLKC